MFSIEPLQQLSNIKIDLSSFILEEHCRNCKKTVENELIKSRDMAHTIFNISPRSSPYLCICLNCSQELEEQEPIISKYSLYKDSDIELTIISAGRYKGLLRTLLRKLKYYDDRLVASDLARFTHRKILILSKTLNKELISAKLPVLIPVPLSKNRLKQRQFNQAELISQKLAKLINAGHKPRLLERVIDTRPQFKLDIKERQENMKNAFRLSKQLEDDKFYILVDDVLTTGTTITECGKQLYDKKRPLPNPELIAISVAC